MATAAAAASSIEIGTYRQQAGMVRGVVAMNLHDTTHAQSLVSPEAGGNNLNFVLGHLLWVYNGLLPALGQEPAVAGERLDRYARGRPPLTNAAEAVDWAELRTAWETACDRIDAGIGSLSPEALDGPGIPTGDEDADPSFRHSLTTVLFHQAYHAGQTGVLRRVAGLRGAIA